MKNYILFLSLLLINSGFSAIPLGKYQIEKIQCKKGKTLKLGGKYINYDIDLFVSESKMKMVAIATAFDWAPFKIKCTQINEGRYTLTGANKYEGDLPNKTATCDPSLWTRFLKDNLFGVEKYGEFTYKVSGKKLTIFNPQTITKYSCDSAGDYPIYYYTKVQ